MPQPATTNARLRVGEFEVDLRSGELRCNGDKVKLQERPFQILAALLERPGEMVSREEIQRKLWPNDTFVDFEHSINTAVKKLREALGDGAENPRFIETLPRRGYRLIAEVQPIGQNGTGTELPISPGEPGFETSAATPRFNRRRILFIAGTLAIFLMTCSLALIFYLSPWHRTSAPSRSSWVQITRFPDGATSPALSPDGRMIAFIRGPETFVSPGQIYVKMLPDGEPVQLTHDNSTKMAPVFSPDGSRIAYTATDASFGWNTWIVPVLGGEPRELLPNAAALTWTDPKHVMFSEIKTRGPMGIAAAQESRAEERNVYLPADGMAHRSWVSPNGKWVLISEMDRIGWRPCRVVPFDGSTVGDTVGPPTARCTYAGWSPDGATMFFSADAGDGYHIWRQHFPRGAPEQLTFGATEEEGIAISADGRTLITSAGIRESTVWLHDRRGDRQISGEGFASMPGLGFAIPSAHSTFSPDGKSLYYLVREKGSRTWNSGELWMADINSGRTEPVLPGVSMSGFDIAPDGERVAFWTPDAAGTPRAWVAPLDRRSPPKQLTLSEAEWPSFGPGGEIYVLMREGAQQLVSSIGPDGIAHRMTTADPNAIFTADSPNGDFLLTGFSPLIAQPVQGGSPIRICSFCSVGWGPGAKFLYFRFRGVGEMGPGKTIAIGLPSGKELPELPPSGLTSVEEAERLNVVAEINSTGMSAFVPGPDPSTYAYVRATIQRNLFRIPLN
jgi:DNA-binding winged helix-turn-helix (wHTH) protein/Tol biopolymer transport system component